jgi:subtilase family serine protease
LTWTQGASAQTSAAISATTVATTGLADGTSVVAQNACPPPTAGRATCLAQVLAARSNLQLVHPRVRGASSPARTAARVRGTVVPAVSAPQAGTPAYLQQAYDLSYLSQTAGSGDTVAIVDAYDDPTAESDLATYRSQFSLPACTTANGCFRKVDQTGGTNYPAPDSDWEMEISLDLDAVSALCPNCHILLVEANTNLYSDLEAAMQEADTLGAEQISDSWGGASSSSPGGTFTFSGVETVAATGDYGYLGAGQDQYPAALPGVTAAGGTTLTPASTQTARGFSESAWSGAGSGCDLSESQPAWQTGFACSGRSYADLSADANPSTGMVVYDTDQGGWLVVGGTSEATPLISAYYALTGVAAQSPEWAYQNASALNDPTGGSNDGTYSCAQSILYICTGGPGYDGPTGAGSISGDVVAGAPGIGGPGAGNSYVSSLNDVSAQLQGGVYPNGLTTTVSVQYGLTTAYGQQAAAAGVVTGQGAQPAAVSLTGLSPSTTYHYRLVAQNADGITYGYDYTLTTAAGPPTVSSPSASSVGPNTATLQSQLGTNGAATTYTFQWGPTASYGSSSSQSVGPSGSGPVSLALTGLAPNTTYHYMISATNASGTVSSSDETFTTLIAQPPAIAVPQANVVSASEATLMATVSTQTASTNYSFQYGTTPALGLGTAPATITAPGSWEVGVTLTALAPATTYYYDVVAQNAGGTTTSQMLFFTTPSAPGPAAPAFPAPGGSTSGGGSGSGGGAGSGSQPVATPTAKNVTIASAAVSGASASVTIRCAGSDACTLSVRLVLHGRLLASRLVNVRAGHSASVRLKLTSASAAFARSHRHQAGAISVTELRQRRWVTAASKSVRLR